MKQRGNISSGVVGRSVIHFPNYNTVNSYYWAKSCGTALLGRWPGRWVGVAGVIVQIF